MKVKDHISLLGFEVQDKVTGYAGVVSSICFDLYGCVQAAITPPLNKEGKCDSGVWMDVTRLKIMSKKRVMDIPNFDYGPVADGKQGAAEKPLMKA